MQKKTKIQDISFNFSLEIIKLYKLLRAEKEYIISKQLLRSATSIGANVHEASAAFSKKDFVHKMAIASKEARETQFWLKILDQGDLINCDLRKYMAEITSIINIITAIVKTTQNRINEN